MGDYTQRENVMWWKCMLHFFFIVRGKNAKDTTLKTRGSKQRKSFSSDLLEEETLWIS